MNGKVIGNHDAIVIAHNGKCAERITSRTPAKAINRLLRVNFNHKLPNNAQSAAGRDPRMTLNR